VYLNELVHPLAPVTKHRPFRRILPISGMRFRHGKERELPDLEVEVWAEDVHHEIKESFCGHISNTSNTLD
jgi:hypothetical protein